MQYEIDEQARILWMDLVSAGSADKVLTATLALIKARPELCSWDWIVECEPMTDDATVQHLAKLEIRNASSGRSQHFQLGFTSIFKSLQLLSGNQLTSRAAWTTSVAKVTFRVPNFAGPASILVNLAGQNKVIKYWVK